MRGLPIELELPPDRFRNKSQEFESFHREGRIPIRRGCGERRAIHVRFGFPDRAAADAFHGRFGGTRLTHSPIKTGRPSAPREEPKTPTQRSIASKPSQMGAEPARAVMDP